MKGRKSQLQISTRAPLLFPLVEGFAWIGAKPLLLKVEFLKVLVEMALSLITPRLNICKNFLTGFPGSSLFLLHPHAYCCQMKFLKILLNYENVLRNMLAMKHNCMINITNLTIQPEENISSSLRLSLYTSPVSTIGLINT